MKKRSRSKIMLFIEDDENFSKPVQNVTERLNIHLILAKGGLQAVELLKELTPTIILMDAYMIGMYGKDFISFLKSNDRLCSIPIIANTAIRMIDDRAHWKDLGCIDLLQRPINEDKLENILRKYIL